MSSEKKKKKQGIFFALPSQTKYKFPAIENTSFYLDCLFRY